MISKTKRKALITSMDFIKTVSLSCFQTIVIDDNKINTLEESTSQQTPSTSEQIIITEAIKVDSQLTPSTSQPVMFIREPIPTQLTPKCSAKKKRMVSIYVL